MARQSKIQEYAPRAAPAAPPERGGLGALLLRQLRVSLVATVVLTVIVSGLYPAVVWGLAQALFHHRANGSLLKKDGTPAGRDDEAVGSELLGQPFGDASYFHPRPSAAGNGYDASASGGTNLGPTSMKLMFGTTKNFAYTVFAADKSHTPLAPVAGRVQGTVVEVTKTTISVTPGGAAAGAKTQYTLDSSVADPNTTVNYHGRTVHAATVPVGAIVELKLNDSTPPLVTTINVADQEIDGGISLVDTGANKITLNDSGGTVINIDPKATVFVVNGKADAKLDAVTTDMTLHAVVAAQMDFDGVADRVIHYCQDNKIDYKASVPDSAFSDADGVDDEKLVAAFNAAKTPTSAPTIQPDAQGVARRARGPARRRRDGFGVGAGPAHQPGQRLPPGQAGGRRAADQPR